MTLPSIKTAENAAPDIFVPIVDEDRANALAATIDVRSPLTVAVFGNDIGKATSKYADELLSQARSADLDELGGKLNEIVVAAQSFSLEALDNRWARAPLIGGIVKRFVLTKEKAMARFSSLEAQVDKLVQSINGTLTRLSSRTETLDSMYDGVHDEHGVLAMHVRAAQIRMGTLEAEIKQLSERASSDSDRELRQRLEASRTALSKRIGDLSVLQHSALQTLPMIRMMQANNIVLLEKFQTIQRLTLPAWKRTFVMALALNEQRDAVKLADEIDDATNYFMLRNSEILHENAVATAKGNQRLVIDVETLQKVHENVVQTLVDVRAAHAEGAAKREAALAELSVLRASLAQLPGQ